MNKCRVMYILNNYPSIPMTYVKSEIEAIRDECEILVMSLTKASIPYKHHAPFRYVNDPAMIREAIEEFQPHVLHSHYLHHVPMMGSFSKQTEIPFTVRAHSCDVLGCEDQLIREAEPFINSGFCLGALSFPFSRPLLEKAGIRSEKIFDCYPVVDYQRFHDRSPNGRAVMNTGACLPKKQMEDFLELATKVSNAEFNLYAVGHEVGKIGHLNEALGNPVNIIPPVEPEDMPGEYKKHRWLVYTASRKLGTVGWPMAIAEAQASGVGVCMANLRADLREYVGNAGFLYDSISEVVDIISKPFPEEMRQIGFEQAKKSDIFEHKVILTDLWRKAIW